MDMDHDFSMNLLSVNSPNLSAISAVGARQSAARQGRSQKNSRSRERRVNDENYSPDGHSSKSPAQTASPAPFHPESTNNDDYPTGPSPLL